MRCNAVKRQCNQFGVHSLMSVSLVLYPSKKSWELLDPHCVKIISSVTPSISEIRIGTDPYERINKVYGSVIEIHEILTRD